MITTAFHHTITDVVITCKGIDGQEVVTDLSLVPRFSSEHTPVVENQNPVAEAYLKLIKGYLDGTVYDLSGIHLDLSHFTEFQKNVIDAARSITWGKTVSYAQLASLAGYPRAVRATASVMRNNRYPLVVPCHRVIRSDGTIGGFQGKQNGSAICLKRKLLALEQIHFESPAQL